MMKWQACQQRTGTGAGRYGFAVSDIAISSGPSNIVLPPVPGEWHDALGAALALEGADRRGGLAAIARAHPSYLEVWAQLAAGAGDDVEAYAYARVGYHRGLDQLRAVGWRGTGYVRWRHEENRGFLRSLEQLRAAAESIGEHAEADRCALFLHQLDPAWEGLG